MSTPAVGVSPIASQASILQPILDALGAAVDAATQPPPTKLGEVTSLATDGSGGIFVRFEGETIPSTRPLLSLLGAYPNPQIGDRVQLLQSGKTWLVLGAVTGGAPSPPVGSVTAFAGGSAPVGWLSCDGSSVSQATYPVLFSVIGTTYGGGSDGGATTFSLPNLSGRTPLGVSGSHAEGSSGGQETVTISQAQLPSHSHSIGSHTHSGPSHAHTAPSHTHDITHGHSESSHTHSESATGSTTVASGTGATVATSTSGTTGSATATVYNYSGSSGSGGGSSTDYQGTGQTGSAGNGTTGSTGSGSSVNVMSPYLALLFIIRAS